VGAFVALQDTSWPLRERLVFWLFGTNGTKKDVILKNEPEKLLIINDRLKKRTQTNPKTKPAMLLKINNGQKSNRRRITEPTASKLAYALPLAVSLHAF
jgi:hypothetical protein